MRTLSLSVLLTCLVLNGACTSSSDDEDGGGSGQAGTGASGGMGGASGTEGGGSSGTSGGDGAGSGGGGGLGGSGGTDADGGTGDGDGGSSFTNVPLADLPDAFADAICDALVACVGPTKVREISRREDCATRLAAELRAQDFAYMDMAIGAGHVLYDPSSLPACLDGIRAMGCAVTMDTYPDPCGDVLAGNVPRGDECLISAECEGSDFCSGRTTCPSTCAPLLGEDAECLGDEECGDGLICLGGTCERPAALGEACAGDSGKVCAFGLSCLGSTDTEAGECEKNSVIQAGALDAACDLTGILCQEGLSCVYDGSGGYHCQSAVEAGAPCYLGAPGQCPPQQYCGGASDVTEQGTCRPLPEAGDPCVLAGLCAAGTTCVTEGQDRICRLVEANGGDCSGDAACRSGHCVEGRCEPPPACL